MHVEDGYAGREKRKFVFVEPPASLFCLYFPWGSVLDSADLLTGESACRYFSV
jgi:hypothetical protein